MKISTEEYIKKVSLIHKNKYDYSLVVDCGATSKIKIICPVHGVFEQRKDLHLNGNGCGKCGNSIRSNLADFIKKSNKFHKNKYNYSLAKYINTNIPLKIICPFHGIFEQTPNNHYKHGCSKCSTEKNSNRKISKSRENFIKKAKLVHDNKYDYSLSIYLKAKNKIKIICPVHGIFTQTVNDHLCGKGCKKCPVIISKPENQIKNFLNSLNVEHINNDRDVLNGKELDFYIKKHKFAIELNGLFYHSTKFKSINYHKNKTDVCEKEGIQLFHIFEDEWIFKQNIVKNIIKSKLNIFDKKINVNECSIKKVNIKISNIFIKENSLSDIIAKNNHVRLGLFFKNELVSLLVLEKSIKNVNNIIFSENKSGYQIKNSFNKFLKYIISDFKFKNIYLLINRRYSNYDKYLNLGFKIDKKLKPKSYFIYRNKRYLKRKTKKDNLIYDSGNFIFVLNL